MSGKLPTVAEYMENVGVIAPLSENIYRYLNFHEIAEFKAGARKALDVAVVAG